MRPDSSSRLDAHQRRLVRCGFLLVRVIWWSLLLPMVSRFFWVFGKWHAGQERTFYISLSILAGLIFAGLVSAFAILFFRVRCPNCNWSFLRNPKSMGPSDFVINKACPSGTLHYFGLRFLPTYQVNPWGVQLLRVTNEKRVRCLHCGTDYDLREAAKDDGSNQSTDPAFASGTPGAGHQSRHP
jgi:hypothetical protein